MNTFTPLEEYLYIVTSFYKIVKDDLWPLSCYHESVEHGWEVVEEYGTGSNTTLNQRDLEISLDILCYTKRWQNFNLFEGA